MKRMLALALALMLALSLASVALADGDAPIAPNTYAPGSKIVLDPALFVQTTQGDAVPMVDVTKDNYTIYSKFTKGSALVESVKIDKEDGVVITLEENYTIDEDKAVEGVITLKARTDARTTYEYTISGTVNPINVRNLVVEVQGSRKADEADIYPATEDNTIYICEEDEGGYVKFNSDSDLLAVTLKMKSEEKVFMHLDEDMISDVAVKYGEDEDVDIYCYSFEGKPALDNAATLTLQADYSDQYYIYEWNGKNLTEVDADFDKEDGVYEWTTKRLGSYVIASEELEAVAADEEAEENEEKQDDKNPDTGANDVVGVAAALAVVSLIAAGAVTLKK